MHIVFIFLTVLFPSLVLHNLSFYSGERDLKFCNDFNDKIFQVC